MTRWTLETRKRLYATVYKVYNIILLFSTYYIFFKGNINIINTHRKFERTININSQQIFRLHYNYL